MEVAKIQYLYGIMLWLLIQLIVSTLQPSAERVLSNGVLHSSQELRIKEQENKYLFTEKSYFLNFGLLYGAEDNNILEIFYSFLNTYHYPTFCHYYLSKFSFFTPP